MSLKISVRFRRLASISRRNPIALRRRQAGNYCFFYLLRNYARRALGIFAYFLVVCPSMISVKFCVRRIFEIRFRKFPSTSLGRGGETILYYFREFNQRCQALRVRVRLNDLFRVGNRRSVLVRRGRGCDEGGSSSRDRWYGNAGSVPAWSPAGGRDEVGPIPSDCGGGCLWRVSGLFPRDPYFFFVRLQGRFTGSVRQGARECYHRTRGTRGCPRLVLPGTKCPG